MGLDCKPGYAGELMQYAGSKARWLFPCRYRSNVFLQKWLYQAVNSGKAGADPKHLVKIHPTSTFHTREYGEEIGR